MKRKKPLRRADPEKIREWKARSEPVNKVNRKRKARTFSEQFGLHRRVEWVQGLPCCVCGASPSENAHVRSRGAGGGPADIVSLCPPHHREQHDVGIETFQKRYNIDLTEVAKMVQQRWEERDG